MLMTSSFSCLLSSVFTPPVNPLERERQGENKHHQILQRSNRYETVDSDVKGGAGCLERDTWWVTPRSLSRSPGFHHSTAPHWTSLASSGPDQQQQQQQHTINTLLSNGLIDQFEFNLSFIGTWQQQTIWKLNSTAGIRAVPWLWWSGSWSCSAPRWGHQRLLESLFHHDWERGREVRERNKRLSFQPSTNTPGSTSHVLKWRRCDMSRCYLQYL